MQEWFSAEWFSWLKFSEYTWARPFILYLLGAIPVLFLIRFYLFNRKKSALPIATINNQIKLGWSRYFRFIPNVLISICLALLIVALARPQSTVRTQNKVSEGIDIVLVVDISESMLNKDILPNRLEASKKMALNFIKGRYQDRIGIVVFSGEAYALSPLTTDYDALKDYIDEIKPSLITADGTAIGSALAVAINKLEEAKSPTKIAILISDGDNTAGNLDPIAAAQLAKAFSVKLYTILVGAYSNGTKDSQNENNYNMSVDQQILENIAKTSDGKYFEANNQQSLKTIFAQINNFEKVKILENSSTDVVDVFPVYIKWAIVFLLLYYFTKITFIGNILED